MKLLVIVLLVATFFLCAVPPSSASLIVPLYRYYNEDALDHLYTVDPDEVGTTTPGEKGKNGYVSEGIACHVLSANLFLSTPFYRYYNEQESNHFYTTDPSELGVAPIGQYVMDNYVIQGAAGYCFLYPLSGSTPLYQYHNMVTHDHIYTTNMEEMDSASDYIYEATVCFVYSDQLKK